MSDVAQRENAPLSDVRADKRPLALGWLWLSVYALVAAGLMSVLLAFARTPFIQDRMPGVDFFKVALVVHVDLSAIVWFFACAGLLWTALSPARRGRMDVVALALTVVGTLMISASPFFGAGTPIMNNYVPVLDHPWFFAGLLLAAIGVGTQAVRFLWCSAPRVAAAPNANVLHWSMYFAAAAFVVALLAFGATYWQLQANASPATAGVAYYEVLFWGGGHVLQIVYTLMVLGAWAALLQAGGTRLANDRALFWLVALAALPAAVAPWLYRFAVDSREHILGFTQLMRIGGLASLPLGALLLYGVFVRRERTAKSLPLRAAVLCSMSLFAAGGIIGFLIKGSNTMIPAHYHGSIVGVTLALMGLIYHLLAYVDRPIAMVRTAHWQPYVYAAGQMLHISGLAFCGGYGVQRKVAGAEQQLESLAETVGMGMMGLGGLISVTGGAMFLVVVLDALLAKSSKAQVPTLSGIRAA